MSNRIKKRRLKDDSAIFSGRYTDKRVSLYQAILNLEKDLVNLFLISSDVTFQCVDFKYDNDDVVLKAIVDIIFNEEDLCYVTEVGAYSKDSHFYRLDEELEDEVDVTEEISYKILKMMDTDDMVELDQEVVAILSEHSRFFKVLLLLCNAIPYSVPIGLDFSIFDNNQWRIEFTNFEIEIKNYKILKISLSEDSISSAGKASTLGKTMDFSEYRYEDNDIFGKLLSYLDLMDTVVENTKGKMVGNKGTESRSKEADSELRNFLKGINLK